MNQLKADAAIVLQTLNLLGGELRDSAGGILTVADRPVVEVRGTVEARVGLAHGRRVAITVPLAPVGLSGRVTALCLARIRINAAKRKLTRAGAVSVRVVAVVGSGDAPILAYELGEVIQPYIEGHVVLHPATASRADILRRGFEILSGLPTTIDLVAVIGEPA